MKKKVSFLGLLVFAAVSPLFAQDDLSATNNSDTTFAKVSLEELNTPLLEVRPLISADGSTLYFSRRSASGSRRKKRDQDIFVVHKDPASGSWGTAEPLAEHLNNKRWNAVASVSPDGKELVLFNAYRRTGKSPLARTVKQEGGWSAPEEIQIQGYKNVNTYADFYLDYQQEVLLLAIEPTKSKRGQDLYVAFPDGKNGWTKPVKMGPVINSAQSEFAPFMGADGRTLFFSSFGHGSQGGSDLFMSVRLDDSWMKWSPPVNLGPAINTADDENYLSIDKDFQHMYHSTQKGGKVEEGGLYRVRLPEDFTAINGPVLSQLKERDIKKIMDSGNYWIHPEGRKTNEEGVAFAGWPADQEQEPEPVATVSEEPAAVSVEEEIFPEEEEHVPARLRGFRPASAVNDLSPAVASLRNYLQEELPGVDLAIRVKGDTAEFKLVQDILFGFNSTETNGEYQQRLDKIARVLKEKNDLQLQLVGHTDSVGPAEVNERLAQVRGDMVRRYLSDKSVSSNRIEVIGAGQLEPIAPNETDEGRSLNRRVEAIIRFVEK